MSGRRISYKYKQIYMRFMSVLLVFSMCFGMVIIGDMTASAEGEEDDGTGGFSLSLKWVGDAADEQFYDYDSDIEATRYVRMKVMYSNDSLPSDYEANQIIIVVPGLNDVVRDSTLKPEAIAADMAIESDKAYDWSYTYNSERNEYTFVNNSEMHKEFVFEGMFEIVWKVNSRTSKDNYYKDISATLTTVNGETAVSNTITYQQKRYKDTYVFTDYNPASRIKSKEGVDELVESGKTSGDYYFVKYSDFPYTYTKRSLGLTTCYEYNEYYYLYCDWNIWVREGVNLCGTDGKVGSDDAMIKKTGIVRTLEDGKQYECWTAKNKYARYRYSGLTFYAAYPREIYETDTAPMVRLEAVGTFKGEGISGIFASKDYYIDDITLFEFNYDGASFGASKISSGVWNSFTEYQCTYPCTTYGAVNATDLKSGNREYNSTLRLTMFDTRVSEGDTVTMEIADDLLQVKTTGGSLRALADDEYNFTAISLPSLESFYNINYLRNKVKNYPTELWIRPAGSADYVLYQEFDFGSEAKNVTFDRNDVVGVKLRIKDFDQTIESYYIGVKYKFHTQADDIQFLTETGEFYNNMYISFYSGDGTLLNPNAEGINYPANFDSQYDLDTYGEYKIRRSFMLHIHVIPSIIDSDVYLSRYKQTKTATMFYASETVDFRLPDGNSIEKFSVYFMLPNDVKLQSLYSTPAKLLDQIRLEGWRYDTGVELTNRFLKNHISGISIDEDYIGNGRDRIAIHFDLGEDAILNQSPGLNDFRISIDKIPLVVDIDTLRNQSTGAIDTVKEYTYMINAYAVIDQDDYWSTETSQDLSDDVKRFCDLPLTGDFSVTSASGNFCKFMMANYAQLESLMSVKTGLTSEFRVPKLNNGEFSDVPYTYENSEYTYRIKFRSGQGMSANIVYVNALETDEKAEWHGTFSGIDISDAESKLNVNGIVYYSDTVVDTSVKPDFSDAEVWTTDKDSLTEVKSVAVVFNNGRLQIGASAYLEIKMISPENTDEALNDCITVNSAMIYYDNVNSDTGEIIPDSSSMIMSNRTAIAMTPFIGKINIFKTDSYDNKPLKGVKFELYKRSADPDVADTLVKNNITTDAAGEAVIQNVVYGNYYLKEVSAPEGYEIPADETLIELIDDEPDKIVNVNISNDRKKTKVTLLKTSDKYSGNHPQGARFRLYYADGTPYNTTTYTTNWSGQIVVELPWDSYYFEETQAPSGYTLDTENNKTAFTIKPNGKLDTGDDYYYEEEEEQSNDIVLEVQNKQKPASIKLTKYEMLEDGTETTTPVAGAVYQLYRSADNTMLGTYITDSSGVINVSDVAIGYYYFIEKIPAQGYQLNTEKVEVNVYASNYGMSIRRTTYDKRKNGTVWFEKKDNEGQPVANAEYGLFRSDGTQVDNERKPSSVTYKTDSSGSITISDLWWGDYYVKEVKSPTGYELNETHYNFSVGKTNVRTYIKLSGVDDRILGKAKLIKTDAETGTKKLEGAVYDLYKGDGTLYKKDITTNADGESAVIEDIPWGSYYFLEKTAPEGYAVSDEKVRFSVNYLSAGKVQEIFAEDKELSGNITVTKKIRIDDAVFAHGNPTFIFKVDGKDTDGNPYTAYRSLTFSEEYVNSFKDIGETYVSLDALFTEIPIGTWKVSEQSTIRYDSDKNRIITSGTVNDDGTVTIELSGDTEDTLSGNVTFLNEKTVQSGTSSAGQEQNIVKRKSKVTSISVIWKGDEYLPDPHIYPSDLDVYVVYDDGTTERLNRSDYDLYVGEDKIDGSYLGDLTNGSYVITIEYGNNDKTSRLYKDSFEVKVAPPTAFTYEVTKDKFEENGVTYDGTAVITGYLGDYAEVIHIPETVDGTNVLVNYFEGGARRGYDNDTYKVVGIKGYYYSSDLTAEGAYASCAYGFKDATTVYLPDSVTLIGDAAFKNCTSLVNLDLTNITEIGDYALYGCTALDVTDIEIPNLVTIGDYGFSKVSQIRSLNLPAIQYVGDYAFAGCEGITKDNEGVLGEMGDDYWTLENGRTYLAYWTDQVTFGEYKTPYSGKGDVVPPMLGRDVFYDTPLYNEAKEHCEGSDDFVLIYTDENCSILSSFLYDKTRINYDDLTDDNISYDRDYSFYNMYIDTRTQSIAAYTFYNCDFITALYCSLPFAAPNVYVIGDCAFSGCYRLRYMFERDSTDFIQDSSTGELNYSAYYAWGSVSVIHYRLGKNVFHGCLSLSRYENIPDGTTSVSRVDFVPYVYDTDDGSYYSVYDVVSYNGYYSLYLPDSVTDIEDYTFYKANLNYFRLPDGLKRIGEGVFRDASFNWWEDGDNYIPDSVTEIGDYAFNGAYFALPLTLSKNLKYIGDHAFEYSNAFSYGDGLVLPDGVTHIGDYAFAYSYINGEMELPDSLTYIGEYAFRENSFTKLTVPGSVANIGEGVFNYCRNLESVEICDGVQTIGPYAFAYCTNLTTVTIPDSVTYIDPTAFEGCPRLRLDGGDTVVVDGITYSKDMKTLISCPTSKTGTIVVPDSVTKIEDRAFYYCSWITGVTLPSGLKSIGDNAFYRCERLTTITLPSGLKSISERAFASCTGLTELTLPDGLTSLGDYVFSSCSNITSLTVPESVTSFGDGMFYYCQKLETVTLPSNMTSIPASTFYWCTKLSSFNMPDGVTSIGNSAFVACRALAGITIPDGVTSIGNSAFSGCSAFTGITIPDAVTSIGNNAFSSCSGLTSITIPESVKTIGYEVFRSCSKLESVVLPKKVDSMGYSAFYNCSKLTSVKVTGGTVNTLPQGKLSVNEMFYSCTSLTNMVLPDGITTLGQNMFNNCTSLESLTIPDSVSEYYYYYNSLNNCTALTDINISAECLCKLYGLSSFNMFDSTGLYRNAPNNSYVYIGETLYKYKGTLPAGTEVVLDEGIKGIAPYAFNGSKNIVSVSGPDVEYVGENAFNNCSNLSSIDLGKLKYMGRYAFTNVNSAATQDGENYIGKVFYKYKGTMPADTEITLREGTTQIANQAFSNCSNMISIDIPASVADIGYYAFSQCTGLTEVNVPSQITVFNDGVFSGCSNLQSVSVPSSLTKFRSYVFRGCKKLESITLPETATYIGGYAFQDCSSLTSITLPSKVTYFGGGLFSNCSALASVTIPTGFNSLSGYTFSGCSSLESIVIPEGITYIQYSEFSGCTKLKSVSLPSSMRWISSYAFRNCSSLDNVTLPDALSYISNETFHGCSSLKNITIPDSVTLIQDEAFAECTSLESITIPDGVTEIGAHAFSGCSALTSIELPAALTTLGAFAFQDCSSLTSVELPDGLVSMGDYAFSLCTSLTEFTVPKNIVELSDYLLMGNTSLTKVVLPDDTVSIGAYDFCDCVSLTTINIPDTVVSIGDFAFYNCSSLSELNVPDTVEHLGALAFDGTVWFNEKYAGEDVIYIGDTLYECVNLPEDSVRIRAGTKRIASGAFKDKRNLEYIYIPDSVTSIEDYAFDGCTNLQNIYNADGTVGVGKNVVSIGDYAFRSTALTYAIMPNVRTVGRYAFAGIGSLSVIIMPKVDTIGTVCKVNSDVYPYYSDMEYMLESFTFSGSYGITVISMPSVRRIGNGAFTDSILLRDPSLEQSGYLILPETLKDMSPMTYYNHPYSNSGDMAAFYNFDHQDGAVYVPNSWVKYWCNTYNDDTNSYWYFADTSSRNYWYFERYEGMREELAIWYYDLMGVSSYFYDEDYFNKYTSDYYNYLGYGGDYGDNCGGVYYYDTPLDIDDNLTKRYAA